MRTNVALLKHVLENWLDMPIRSQDQARARLNVLNLYPDWRYYVLKHFDGAQANRIFTHVSSLRAKLKDQNGSK